MARAHRRQLPALETFHRPVCPRFTGKILLIKHLSAVATG